MKDYLNGNEQVYRRKHRKKKKPTKPKIIKESIKTISKEYCAESSICGLKHLVSENTSFIERIIWIITLIGALICSISLVRVTFLKYYQAPLVTTQMPEGISVNTIIFPAVGICTNNRISNKAVTELAHNLLKEERNKQYSEEEMLNLLFNLGQLYHSIQPVSELESTMKLHQALGEYDVNEIIKSLTPRCESLLLKCAWNEEPMNCTSLFDFRLTMNGYCCTFNYLRPSDKFEDSNGNARSMDMYNYGNKSSFDFDQGLKVLIKLDESDDFFYNIPLQGAQLQFSDAYDFPDAPSGSFAMQIISPSVQMSVMVSASFTTASRDIQHVPVKLRSCLFHDESSYLPFYTHSDCMLKCRMLFILDNCNCTPFNMPKMFNTRTCDMRDVKCLRKYYAQSISLRPEVDPVPKELELDLVGGGIRCPMCYPTCSKTVYNYDFINVNIYPDQLNTVPDEDRNDWLRGANYTGTSIVHVKYARATADWYGQNVIMKWFDLISNIGSTCGFVTGFSFVSVLEFIYFFTVKLIREMRRRREDQRRATLAIEPTPAHIKPLKGYRPIYWNELPGTMRGGSTSLVINMSTDSVKRYVEIWWNGIQSFPETTSIHGFRFVADSKRHWIERIFWFTLVALSWYGSALLIAAQYDAFQNNPISFVVETTYKDWDTHFPSVAVCENDNTKRIEEISDGLWGEDHDFNMEEVLKEMAYFKGITYYTSEFCGLEDPLPDCIKSNISHYANLVRSPCRDTLSNCSWNDEPFDCCTYFTPMDTELGTCFAINTIQGRNPTALKLPMISNKTTGPGAIKFNVQVTANVYVLNEEEVPTLTTIGSDVLTVGPEVSHRRYITIRNVENDYGARLIRPAKRKCRYSDENFLQVYRHYSYTACTVQCRKDAQLRMCNCTNYFMPNVPDHLKCDVKGIICLNDHVQELSVLKARWSSRPGLYCDCLPSCTEAEISIMKDFKVTTGDNFATVQIALSMLPSERYRRNVVRGVLDLVVSTGGTCGLFLGVSILSFVELIYILMVRPFCDIYSQRDDDPWYKKFGTRKLEDNKFAPNLDWRYHRAKTQDQDIQIKQRK